MATLYFKVASNYEEVVKLREEIEKLKKELLGMNKTQAPEAVADLETKLSSAKEKMKSLVTEAAKAGTEMENNFKKKIYDASTTVNDLTQKIIAQKDVVKKTEYDVKKLGEAYRNLPKYDPARTTTFKEFTSAKKTLDEERAALFGLQQQQASARLTVKALKDEYTLFKQEAEGVNNSTQLFGVSLQKALVGIGGVAALKSVVSSMIKVRGEFQAADTAIETLLGNKEKADALMKQVRDYAKISPLEFSDVTKATQMMLGFNIEAEKIPRYLQAIGDVSMGDTQRFNSLTLAFSQMSAAGKLMGQDLNQMINAGFNPLQILSEKTGKSMAVLKDEMSKGAISAEMVQQAFIDATSAGGKFYQMSENASKTINGQISMLNDAIDSAFNEIGTKTEGIIMGAINVTTKLVENYETIGKILTGLITTYGVYKTAVLLVNAAENGHNIAMLVTEGRILLVQKAQALLNKTMLANPYVATAVALSALVSAAWAFSDSLSAAERTQDVLNKRLDDISEKSSKRAAEIDRLVGLIHDETTAETERYQAIQKLRTLLPESTKGLTDEQIKTMELTSAKKSYNEELAKQLGLEKQRELNRLYSEQSYLQGAIESGKRGNTKQQIEAKKDAERLKIIREQIEKLEAEKKAFLEAKNKVESTVETKNKAYWEKIKREAESARNALDVSQKGSKAWNEFTKKITEAQKKLDTYSYSKTNKNKDKDIKDQQNKINQALLNLEQKNQQDRIALMKEGTAKELAQIQSDYNNKIDELNKQEQEWRKVQSNNLTQEQETVLSEARINAQKTKEKSENNLTQELLNQYQSYTDKRLEIEKKFNDDIEALKAERKKAEEKGDAEAISQIDRSIAKATTEKGKALISHDYEVLKQSPEYIRAFEDLKNTSSETLNSLLAQFENAKSEAAKVLSPDQLREYTNTIQSIMDELDARNPFQALTNKQKELSEASKALAEAKRQLDFVNNGGKIITGTKINDDTGKIEATYLSASEALENYNKSLDNTAKAENKYLKAERKVLDQVDELASSINNVGSAIGGTAGEIISFIGDITSFVSNSIDSISTITAIGTNAVSAVEKASVILTIASTAIQLFQKIDSLIGNKANSQYENYAAKIAEVNKLTDAVNSYKLAVLEAEQAEKSWFAEDNLQSLKDLKAINDQVLEDYEEKLYESQAIYQNKKGGSSWLRKIGGALAGGLFWDSIIGTNILGNNNKYQEGQTAAINNLRIETQSAKKGGLFKKGRNQKTEDLRTWAKENGFGDLFDEKNMLNKETAQAILDQYGDKLVGQTKETLEALLEMREKYDEYLEQLHEYVSSMYEPIVDSFVDSIWTWFDEGKDALDSFRDYASDVFRDIVSDMLRTIILDKVIGTFSDDIAKLYEQYNAGEITEEELMAKVAEETAKTAGRFEEQIPTLQNLVTNIGDTLKETTGIDIKGISTTEQESSKRGFATASQDSIDELNGRFTAGQIAWEETKNQAILQNQNLSLLNAKADLLASLESQYVNIADESRTIMANSFLELQQISENTEAIIKPIKTMASDISELKKHMSRL